ncbi:MAG: hypothetical protein AAFQ74_17330 [Cyanobacteria bacterium J06623_4]
MGSNSVKGLYSGGFRWWLTAGVAALASAGTVLSPLAAIAAELRDWQYDTQTQILTLTLPLAVTPTVSVVAPDQLLLELPNTQVGDVMGQTVGDGLVDNIVLEQATPETVWMVMEFAAGTVLSASQSATPLASETDGSEQQWQVRPTLIAASRQAVNTSVATAQGDGEAVGPVGASASQLREPAGAIAQAPDFSDLPILEPAMPIDEPVVVPPLEPVVPAASAEETADEAAEEVVEAEVADEGDRSGVSVEVIPAERPQDRPVVSQPVPRASEQTTATGAAPVDNVVPSEPPFIGNLEGSGQSNPPDVGVPSEAPTAEPPSFDDLPVVEAGEQAPSLERPNVVSVPNVMNSAASAPAPAPPVPESIAEPLPEAQIASGSTVEAAPEAVTAENAVPTDETGRVIPSSVSRWPEPIPFGQPLP